MRPDYGTNNPRGWGGNPSRGAALGRNDRAPDVCPNGRLTLRRVHLDVGGYDPNGTYYGIGAPLYWCADDSGDLDWVFRAATREAAKAHVRARYPDARFWR